MTSLVWNERVFNVAASISAGDAADILCNLLKLALPAIATLLAIRIPGTTYLSFFCVSYSEYLAMPSLSVTV